MNQLKAGAALNYIIIALNTIVGLAYTPYLLRCLGQNEYGLYSLVSSVIAYLTILDFGFGNAIIRYTSKLRSERKIKEQWEMFGMFLIIYSIIGLIAMVGGLGLFFNVNALFDRTMSSDEISQAQTMMLLLTLNLALTFPLSIFGAIISAYENFVYQRVISICRILLCTGVMIGLLSMGYKAIALVVVNTVFNILTLLLNVIYCKYKLKISIRFVRFNWPFLKEVCIYSFWIFLNAIMDKIYWGTGQFVLGAVSGTVAVAIFSVAIMLQQMYMQFSTSIANVLLPRMTSMVAMNSSNQEISDMFIKTGRLQCIIMTLVLSGFIVFGQQFIDVWAGCDYRESFLITLIFFIALFIPLIQNTGIVILQARNQMKFRSILYLVISIVSLAAQFLLAKEMGATGCAIAIGGALIIGQGLIMNLYYYKKQNIDIPLFWKEILKMLLIPIIITVCAYYVAGFYNFNNILNLIVGIAAYMVVYIPCIWKFSINSYERSLLLSPINRIRRK